MSNTTADKLALLAANKANIKSAINLLNPSTAPTDVLSQWPDAIKSTKTLHKFCRGYGAYFLTPHSVNQNTVIEYSFRVLKSRINNVTEEYVVGWYNCGQYLAARGCFKSSTTALSESAIIGEESIRLSMSCERFLRNGIGFSEFYTVLDNLEKISIPRTTTTWNGNVSNIAVGGRSTVTASGGSISIAGIFQGDIENVVIYGEDSEVIADYQATEVNGVGGFYDTVSKAFYTSANSNTFTYMEEYV